jgi:hypothetical protein
VWAKGAQELKESVDQLLAKVNPLEIQVQTLRGSLVDSVAELRARELSLERATAAKEDHGKQNTQLTKKLDGKLPSSSSILAPPTALSIYVLFRAESVAELKALKTIAENVVPYFYPQDSEITRRAPQLLDSLPTRSQDSEITRRAPQLLDSLPTRSRGLVQSSMPKASSLSLGIVKYLYPDAELELASEGFAATCSNERKPANLLIIS